MNRRHPLGSRPRLANPARSAADPAGTHPAGAPRTPGRPMMIDANVLLEMLAEDEERYFRRWREGER
jgi:hypothetical protein